MTPTNDTGTLRMRVRIAAPPATVFAALTDPDSLAEWMVDTADVALDEGRYQFWGRYAPYGDRPRQQLTGHETDRSLRFDWQLHDDSAPSAVEIELSADGPEATVVTVAHTGIPADDDTRLECFWTVSVANLVAQCEGVATMPPFDFSAPAQDAALVHTVIDVSAEDVYTSLLTPAQVDKWAGGKASIEPTVGGRYDFGWDHGPVAIVELEPEKVLAYSWRYPDNPDTVVRWQLREARGSTFITLIHSGFTDFAVAEQFRQGWPGFLVEIKRILELGDAWEPLKVA